MEGWVRGGSTGWVGRPPTLSIVAALILTAESPAHSTLVCWHAPAPPTPVPARPSFEEGIKGMHIGGQRRIIVPPELGPPVGPSTFFSAKQYEARCQPPPCKPFQFSTLGEVFDWSKSAEICRSNFCKIGQFFAGPN